MIAYADDDSVFVTEVSTGKTSRVAPRDPARPVLPLAVDFSHDGKQIAYERVVKGTDGEYNQIFVTELTE
ncbi:hypothetical protein ACI3L1_15255 [Deinococcus sp. SM5_A1]|uniref:hypothetical protein n=1 Tax=Deinococcus sp. SM5_A1 TaxID=3379094 RepID=UPI00385B8CA7